MNGKLNCRAESQQFRHICISSDEEGKFTLQRAMNAYRRNTGIHVTIISLASAQDVGGWSTPRSRRFNRGNDRPCNHWVGPMTSLDGCEKSRRYRD